VHEKETDQMPILNTVAKKLTQPLPRFFSPTAHAVADYVIAGAFLAAGALFWRRSKRAALGAFVCGGSELAVSLLTDYPGGMKKIISFPVHRELDWGLAGMTALMPEFMKFEHETEMAFFLLQGAVITALTNVTDFQEPPGRSGRSLLESLMKAA
jgi:hypothetical protein